MNSATVATANVNTDSSAASTQVSNSDAAVTSASADTNVQGSNVVNEQQTAQARADWYSGYSTGWQSSRNYDGTYDWTYRKADGTRASNEWLLINGSWYYFNGPTMAANGWCDAPWYGQYHSYYFDANGHYVTNSWHARRNYDGTYDWTYSKADGTQANSEWLWINGAWYYFDGPTMAANGWHDAPWYGQ